MSRADSVPHSLQVWRRFRRLTQRMLAERSAVSLATIYRIERGATRPRPVVARRLAGALETAPVCIAELSGAVPQLPRERAYLAASDNGVGTVVDEQLFSVDPLADELGDG
jgi:transcriptional regulator with XRE-family HTH domain